jgi:hypothetical protein
VRARRTIGATSKIVGLPPDAVTVSNIYANGAVSTTVPAGPAGTTSALLFVCCVGGTGLTGVTGWATLASGVDGSSSFFNSSLEWAVLSIDNYVGSEGRNFSFPGPVSEGLHDYVRGFVAHFSGGTGGGGWTIASGEKYSGSAIATMTTPPAGTGPYMQFGGLTGVYGAPTVPAGTIGDQGPAGAYWVPGTGSYSGASFASNFVSRTPYTVSDTVTWGTLGSYGPPNSVSFAARWIP